MPNIQVRPRGSDGPMYSPQRDFAHNYPQLISCIIRAFNTNYWPKLIDALGGNDAWEAACEAKDAYCKFLNICTDDPEETVSDVLRRSGFEDVPEVGKIAFLAMMGQVMTGQLFMGLRDITPLVEKPACLDDLCKAMEDGRRALNGVTKESEQEDLKAQLSLVVRRLTGTGLAKKTVREFCDEALKE